MISNYKIKSLQKSRQTQLNTCLFESIKPKSSPLNSTITSLNSKTTLSVATMSSMTADLCAVAAAAAAATAAKTTTRKPPMEAVVVNSIIYSKPSFCSIVVDLGGSAGGEVPSLKDKLPKLLNGACPDKTSNNTGFNSTTMPFPLGFASACLTGFSSPPPSVAAQQDAQLYRMCTTMNGSIHHQISDLCDNLLAMAGFLDAATNEHDNDDDDDLVEFVYDDGHYMEEEEFNTEDENEDDEDEETDDDDDIDVEYCNNNYDDCLDDDHDTVDFTYGFSTINTPKLICDKGKKVRFNTKPTIHVMHTWNYAYRAARKGQWEMYARDRERFRLRIQRTSLILNPILNREHRQKIFEKRFVNIFDTNSDRQTPDDVKVKTPVATENVENKSSHTESKNSYQKKKPKKRRRFCKMGNKHYF